MKSLNNWIWATGLVLQCALLGFLPWRGAARRLPLFSGLIAFYVLRSVFLFVGHGQLSSESYSVSVGALSTLDVVLQVLVGWELLRTAGSTPFPGSRWRRLATFCGLVALSAAGAWGISATVPASYRSPVDRGVLLPCLLMILVAAFAFFRPGRTFTSTPSRVLLGFAVLGATGVATQIGRALAALHLQASAYTTWSYSGAFLYLAVLIWWIVALFSEPKVPRPARGR